MFRYRRAGTWGGTSAYRNCKCRHHYSFRSWWTNETAIDPSPSADATRFTLPARTSPAERLAEQLAMSPRSLSRWFQKEVKETPAAFLRNLRLQEAKRLLSESNLGLSDIASRAGLGDHSTLWRTFSRQLGISPDDYRKRFNIKFGRRK
jgi:AraC-like DNA-binding protein